MPTLLLPRPGDRTFRLSASASAWFARCFGMPVLAVSVYASLVFLWVPASIADPDIWWHLRNAQEQLQRHAFLRQDLYSYTAARAPWINHEWLAELPFYIAWRLLGPMGLYLVTLVTIEAIMLAVLYLSYLKSRSLVSSLVVSVAATVLATVSFAPRTLLFGWLCLALELIVLELYPSRRSLIWTLPALFLVWVNLHGSWLIGFVLFACFVASGCVRLDFERLRTRAWVSAERRELLLAGGFSFCALFVNPYGWRLLAYPFDMKFRQQLNIANVEEWRSLDLHSPRGRVLLVSLAVLFVLQLVRGRTWVLQDLLFLSIGVYAACNYSRFLFLAGMLVMPILGRHLPAVERGTQSKERYGINLLILCALIPIIVQRLPRQEDLRKLDQRYPLQALTFLRSFHPQGRVLNDYLWGGYLEWNVPGIPVFVDSRVDIFEYNGSFRDYLAMVRLQRSLALLSQYKIRYVLFPRDAAMVYLLKNTAGWKTDYEDESAVFLERTEP